MSLQFDPAKSEIADIFAHEFGRTFYLLWRRQHLVSPHFAETTRVIISRWDVFKPKDWQELVKIIPIGGYDLTLKDVEAFCREYWDYFAKPELVTYELKLPTSV